MLRAVSRLADSPRPLLLATLAFSSCREPSRPGNEGKVVWHVPGHGWAVAPSVDSSTAYYGSFEHQVVAIDKAAGRVRWTRSTAVTGPYTNGHNTVLAAGVVAIGDVDVHAFDRTTGEPRWVFRPANGDRTGHGWLASDGATIYADSPEGRVYAIDGASGAQRWATDLTGGREMTSTMHPTLEGGVLFVGVYRLGFNGTGALAALDAGSGRVLWTREFAPESAGQYSGSFGGAAYHGDKVIVSAEDGRVYALRRATGDLVWIAPRVHELPPLGPFNDARPLAVGGDVVVVGSSLGIVVGLDAGTGRELWRSSNETSSVSGAIAVDDNAAYVGHSSSLVVYGLRSGAVLWASFARPDNRGGYWAPPAIDGDRLYVPARDGFYSLRRQ